MGIRSSSLCHLVSNGIGKQLMASMSQAIQIRLCLKPYCSTVDISRLKKTTAVRRFFCIRYLWFIMMLITSVRRYRVFGYLQRLIKIRPHLIKLRREAWSVLDRFRNTGPFGNLESQTNKQNPHWRFCQSPIIKFKNHHIYQRLTGIQSKALIGD